MNPNEEYTKEDIKFYKELALLIPGGSYTIIKSKKKKPTDLEIFDKEKILQEELSKADDINRAYNEIGNKNICGLSSTQTTLPRNEYWNQVNILKKRLEGIFD